MNRAYRTVSVLVFIAGLGMTCGATETTVSPSSAEAKAITKKLADWQIETFEQMGEYRPVPANRRNRRSQQKYRDLEWLNAALCIGMNLWCGIAENPAKYTDWLKMIGSRNGWNLHRPRYHGNPKTSSVTMKSECKNLLVPMCVSSSHIVFN